jgi:hypothetical protein
MLLDKSIKFVFLGLALVVLLATGLIFQQKAFAFSLMNGPQISIFNSPSPTPIPWTIKDKISEAKKLLDGITLKVGTTDITYTEDRISPTSITHKTIKDPEKEIALAALNTTTGEISVIKITKHGAELIPPPNWSISITSRVSGIRWNSWNTAFHVDSPENYVIIANLYPEEKNTTVTQKKNGKKVSFVNQTIKYHFYSPFSPDILTPELINAGEQYVHDMVAQALSELQAAGVGSAAIAGATVYDVWKDKAVFFERIPLLEQSDLTEFMLDPENTTQRIYTIIGANGDLAFANTCNSSSACGWVQFTPATYKTIVKTYPKAGIISDFITGAADHENSIKAAILLYDQNLKGLIKSNGQKVLQDPKLEEYLAASYNGSPSRATKSLTASILGSVEDWINALTSKKGGLASETRGYLVKLRYLQEHAS